MSPGGMVECWFEQVHDAVVNCRCLDRFESLSNKPISVAHLPQINQWWATGRFGKVAAFDPRSPAIVTEYVAAPNQLTVSNQRGSGV